MRKTLKDIYNTAWSRYYAAQCHPDVCDDMAIKAVASAVRKRVKRKIEADARRKEMADSKWVLR